LVIEIILYYTLHKGNNDYNDDDDDDDDDDNNNNNNNNNNNEFGNSNIGFSISNYFSSLFNCFHYGRCETNYEYILPFLTVRLV
jgi:hypothetical protein